MNDIQQTNGMTFGQTPGGSSWRPTGLDPHPQQGFEPPGWGTPGGPGGMPGSGGSGILQSLFGNVNATQMPPGGWPTPPRDPRYTYNPDGTTQDTFGPSGWTQPPGQPGSLGGGGPSGIPTSDIGAQIPGFGQMPTNPGGPSVPSALGGSGGTVPQMLAYAQRLQAQGMYTPSNGPQGVPSQGWDGWSGYNPTQPQQSSGGGTPQVSTSYSPGSYHGPAPGDGGAGAPPSPMTQVPTGVQTHDFATPTGPRGTQQWGDMGSRADLIGYKNNPASAVGTPYERFMSGGEGVGPTDFNKAAAAGYMRSGGLTGIGSHRAAMANRMAMNPNTAPTTHRDSILGGSGTDIASLLRHQNAGNGQMTAAMTQARNGQAPGVLNPDQLAQRMRRFGY
jgi:hypothetical protein